MNTPFELGDGEPHTAAPLSSTSLASTQRLWRLVDVVLLVGVLSMVFTVSLQIVSRWWGLSNNWTEELTRFLFMGTTFFGLAAGMRTAAHPRVAYFVTHGPAWLRTFSVHLYALCSVVLFGVLVVMSSRLVLQQVASGESSPSLGLRMFIVTLPFVIGAALSIIATIQSIYRDPELKARVERGELIA